MTDTVDARRRLRLVAEQPVALRRGPAAGSLAAAPFRPGELPVLRWVTLGADARRAVRERATQAGVPAELWLRLAVEASRLLDEIAALSARRRADVEMHLDAAATERLASPVEALDAVGLKRYAESLQRGGNSSPLRPEAPLRLSEETAGSWGRTAATRHTSLPSWIAAHVHRAPRRCVDWEVAAASECRTMAEWAYASSLRRLTSSMA